MRTIRLGLLLVLPLLLAAGDDDIDKKYPLGDQLRVLAADAVSPAYRKLVEEMNSQDLRFEWPRVETLDNAESFADKHGGLDHVLADPELKLAYERRVKIREQFLDVMRVGYKRFGTKPPFDQGSKAEKAGTTAGTIEAKRSPLAIVLPSEGAEKNWPRFRGPWGQGNAAEKRLPVRWDSDTNVVWKTALPGVGNSSPVIWGDRIFLTSSGEKGVERQTVCLRRSDGKLLWTRAVPEHKVEPQVNPKNGFASSTPITDGHRVVAFFGSGGLICFDFEGTELWHYPLPGFDTMWGTASSPIFYHDLVILIQDQNRAPSLFIAVNETTGKLVWQHERPKAMGWATPVVLRVDDHDELIYNGSNQVVGYDPASGKELWALEGSSREAIPTIVVGKDLIYSASGRQGPTLALRPGGTGDVTGTHLAWRTVRGGPHVPTPILVGNGLYTVNDTGIATCLDAQTGELVWQDRVRGKFSASPIEAGGLMYFCNESGITYVLRAGDKLDFVAENDLGSPILASPAALDGRLYIRTQHEVFCIAEDGHAQAAAK